MYITQRHARCRAWSIAIALGVLATGCGRDGKDSIFGSNGIAGMAPTVTAAVPLNGAIDVTTNNPLITATFSEPMQPITGTASMTVTCAAPCTNATGTVTLDATSTIATFTLTPGTALSILTQYTVTITGAMSLSSGIPIAAPYSWQFTTAATTDARPQVLTTIPVTTIPGPTPAVPSNSLISAVFSKSMAPATINAQSFTLTCTACTAPTGTVTYSAATNTAVFTPAADLTPGQTYTATITTAATDLDGIALEGNQAPPPGASNYVWTFTAGAPDLTRPTVVLTDPATTTPGPTPGVPSNTAIVAVFSKSMAPATINAQSFTVTCTAPCVSPAGTVSYSVATKTAVFTPAANLAVGDTYKATITTAATDTLGNALASNYVWTFTTVGPTAAGHVTVLSTNPAANSTTACPNTGINATFTVPSGLRMNPATVTATTFTVTGPAPASTPVTASSITLDTATGTIATFTPQSPLTAGVTYTATIEGGANGVSDLAVPPNTMLVNFTWNFTVATSSTTCPATIVLGAAAPFGTLGGSAGTTNQGVLTVINGDIGTTAVSTKVTGFHDTGVGCTYTEVPGADIGTVNGLIYTAPPPPTVACPNEGTAATFAIASQARADALIAYNALVAAPGGPNAGAGNLAGLTLYPGDYTAAAGSFMIQGGDLTLDAQGNANAVWIFQMATTLTVGGPGAAAPSNVILANGAQAKNVYWQVGSAATINAAGGGTMVGTIIAQAGAAFSTHGNVNVVTLNGRVLSLGASVTMVDTVINVPAP
jgi:hypothetical protein